MEQSDAPEKNSRSPSAEVAIAERCAVRAGTKEYTTARAAAAVAPKREHWCTIDYHVHY